MALFNYGFKKKDFIYGGIITAIIAMIGLLLILIGLSTAVFDPIGQTIDNYRLSDGFFFSRTNRTAASEDINPNIIIVDIQDCDSREEIASIIHTINQASPKALAVDIIFGKYSSASSQEDSLLVAALKECPNLLLAQRNIYSENGWHSERSFFADDIPCQEGDVSFDFGIVRSFSGSIDVNGITVPSLTSLIANEAGLNIPKGELLINFSPVRTITLGPDELSRTDILKDQIIILGDAGDLRDFHNIPVIIHGQPRTSGVNIIAQSLYTLQPNRRFYSCPEWLAVIIGVILTYLFCTFIASPMFRREKFNGLWISIWQVLVLLILIFITYILFWDFHIDMTLTYWLIGVGLSELATELFYFVKPNSI